MNDPTRSNVRQSVSAAGERIQEIIDTAERVAAQIQADAEREASAYLEARRREADNLVHSRAAELVEMRNALTTGAARIEAKTAELLAAIDVALASVREGDAGAAPMAPRPAQPTPEPVVPPAAPDPPRATTPEPEPEARMRAVPDERGSGPGQASLEAAMLRATQLAVAGRDRSEIEATIQAEFKVGDPRAVVDQILGTS